MMYLDCEVVHAEETTCTALAQRRKQQDGDAPSLIHQRRGDDREDNLHSLDAHGIRVGDGRGEHGLQDGAAVEHHSVDAAELLDEHETDADQQRLPGVERGC